MSFKIVHLISLMRHPELVSGSMWQSYLYPVGKKVPCRRAVLKTAGQAARWTLKRVQGDGVLGLVS
jgi:hypothetical protein